MITTNLSHLFLHINSVHKSNFTKTKTPKLLIMNHGGGNMPNMAAPPPSNTTGMMHRRHMMMHMTFFWGKDTLILFDGFPGYGHLGMYILALAIVFFLAVFVEWLSHCNILRDKSDRKSMAVGVLQTLMYGVRIGLAYIVMLAVMSFNAGVFLVAVFGHAFGFFLFGSRAFHVPVTTVDGKSRTDLPPHGC